MKYAMSSERQFLCFIVALFLFSITGCQSVLRSSTELNTSNYGNYYLWVKSLNAEELQKEINLQKQQLEQGDEIANMQLVILYSLPNSPIYNPYTAKSKLNQHDVFTQSEQLNSTDFSFIVLLKDQLNQQLLLLNKLIASEEVNNESKKQFEQQQQSIELLESQSLKLREQIKQLKNIEENINEHG